MCSQFCTCPGIISDEHYKQYQDITKEEYKKYNRTFYPEVTADDLEKLKSTDPLKFKEAIMKDKSLHWAPEATQGKITTDTMIKCYEEAVKISAELSKSEEKDTATSDDQKKNLENAKPD